MIWTSDARALLKELKDGDSVLTLDFITLEAGANTVTGRGSLKRSHGRFELTVRFGPEGIDGNMAEFVMGGMQGPRIITRDDFWKMSACTSGGVNFECLVSPASERNIKNGGLANIRCSIDKITIKPKMLDVTDYRFLEKTIQSLNDSEALKESFTVSLDSPVSVPSKFHAILPGVKCVCAEHFTKIERSNVFLQTTSSEKRDTFIHENEERRIALIEADGDLHIYLELPPGERTEEDEKTSFSALLDAVAFTHGCHPHPTLKEYSRSGRVVFCELSAVENLEIASMKPLNRSVSHLVSGSKTMLSVAYEFFKDDKAIIRRIKKTMWLYRDASSKAVPLPIQVLTACTLFEGLIKNLFDVHGLKGPTKMGGPSLAFNVNKQVAKELLMTKHREEATNAETESDWSRMAGHLHGCDYVRPKERLKAVAEHYGFPWENDVEGIYEIWNGSRHGLAHGGEVTLDAKTVERLFIAWSRLSGAIHRFILAEMGYAGRFAYSPMEAGLEEITISPK